MWEDGVSTNSSEEQKNLEHRVQALYSHFIDTGVSDDDPRLKLLRSMHAEYLYGGLGELPPGFRSMDASRPWICYWILHSLALLQHPLPSSPPRPSIIDFLAACQHPGGGFGGGPYQLPHLATTYAAVAALVTLGDADALGVINRDAIFAFFLEMCVPRAQGGGMTMHRGGEIDIRGCYCAFAVCHMLCLDVDALAEACSLERYVAACQSMEGGLGGEPGNEAHGGYAFCGFAALVLAKRRAAVDAERLAGWASRMQGWMEGGFMGRTGKLVDGCYSMWQGGIFPLLAAEDLNFSKKTVMKSDDDTAKAAVDAALAGETCTSIAAELEEIKALRVCAPEVEAEVAVQSALLQVTAATDAKAKLTRSHPSDMAVFRADVAMADEDESDAKAVWESAEEHLASTACAAAKLLERYPLQNNSIALLYDPLALQLWLLVCCQVTSIDGKSKNRGGMRDKPGKHPDYYHTCYCLSGLSSAQHASGCVLGGARNLLAKADPLCNVVAERVAAARAHFS